MDKREFMQTGVAVLGAGVTGAVGSTAALAEPKRTSVKELELLIAQNPENSHMFRGYELTSLAISTTKHRLWFVADPAGFAQAHNMEVQPEFLEFLRLKVEDIDNQYSEAIKKVRAGGSPNGRAVVPQPQALPVVVAAAAVVSAAAAVVSAVAITYIAFKWNQS
jgi:hypothetical protein